jgi:epoxyqueuosine reductase
MKASVATFGSRLKKAALNMGASSVGIADLDLLKKKTPDLLNLVGEDFSRAVVLGMRLQEAAVSGIVDKPTTIYFHNYRQLNYQLDSVALLLAGMIQDAGFRALAIPASQIVARDPMRGHISHKLLGWAAGIGFIGRNTLLIHPEYGARMRYVSILTDMPLKPDKPLSGEGCGPCKACISVCPAAAIGATRDEFNLHACFEKLTEFTRLSFIGQHICGVCVKACRGQAAIKKRVTTKGAHLRQGYGGQAKRTK